MTEFVLGKDLRKITEDKSTLNLGEYQDVYKTSKLFWATEYQQFFRVIRMWRKAQVISETNCIVEIFGIGFNGRMFSHGSSTPKLLIIEVYSIWNSQKYVAILNMLELRILLGEKTELFHPGCKMDVVKAIIASLYFKYTVTIPSHQHSDDGKNMVQDILNNNNNNDDNMKINKTASTVIKMTNCTSDAGGDRDIINYLKKCPTLVVQTTVIHLEKPKMPKGYPTSIEQMIRIPPLQPDDESLPIPIITQELALRAGKCGNGIKSRILEAKQRTKRLEEEEERQRLRWLSTIKRKRDLVATRLIRTGQRFALIIAYHEALRPTTITIKSIVFDEAVNMKLYVGLNAIQCLLSIKRSSSLSWTAEEVKSYTSQVLKLVKLKLLDGNRLVLKLNELSSSEAELVKIRKLSNLMKTMKYRRSFCKVVCLWEKLITVDATCSIDSNDVNDNNSNHNINNGKDEIVKPPLPRITAQEQTTAPSLLEYQHEQHNWLSLGRNGRNRTHYGKLLGVILRPYCEIGQGMRLTSRCTRIGRVFCIYKLYAHTKVGFRGSIPEWPPKGNTNPIDDGAVVVEDTSIDNNNNENEVIIDSDSDEFVLPGNDDDDSDKNEDDGALKSEDSILNIVDMYNDAYATIAAGLILELSIYIPYGGYHGDLSINAGTKYKLRFLKSDLDTLVSVKTRQSLLGIALCSLYHQFYYEATEDEVMKAEEAWDIIGKEIMSRSRWDMKEQLLDIFKTHDINSIQKLGKTDMIQEKLCFEEKIKYIKSLTQRYASLAHEANNSEKDSGGVISSQCGSIAKVTFNLPNNPSNNDEIEFADNETVLYSKELSISNETVTNKILNDDSTDVISIETTGNNGKDDVFLKPSYLTLTWSNLIYRKVMKIKSAVVYRGEFVLLQIDVWQKNDVLGVVCYDKVKNDVYFTQHSDEALLSSQIHSFHFMSDSERVMQIYFFLSAQLTYTEYLDKSDNCQGKITFMDAELEKSTIELSNVIEDDYSSNTEIMLAAAQEKAKARFKRK